MRFDLSDYPQWQRLVLTKPEYRKAWLQGTFPPVNVQKQIQSVREQRSKSPPQQPRKLLGDRVSSALAVVGITEDRVSKWLGRPCGCSRRRDKLNRIDAWARGVISKTIDDAKESLERIIGR